MAAVLVISAGILWYVRKAGRDAERADQASEALDRAADANRPVAPDELKRVRERFKRTECISFRPITYSSRDTPETVAQIEAHNVKWTRLCE